MRLDELLRQWPDVPDEQYDKVHLGTGAWERCMGRMVATLTRRPEWEAARQAGGPGWIHAVAVRRARRYGTPSNAPAWLDYLRTIGRQQPVSKLQRMQARLAIDRFWHAEHRGSSRLVA